MSELKVFLVDQQAIIRQGIAMLINHQPGLKVVGQSENATKAIAEIVQCAPDVVIVSPELPGKGSVEIILELKKKRLPINFLALAHEFNPLHFRMIMQAGAKGYVLKSNSVESLMKAIQMVAAGKVYLDQEIIPQCLDLILTMKSLDSDPHVKQLTQREELVLRMWVKGSSSRQIAEHLKRSNKTVDTMRVRAMAKLGLQSREDSLKYALQAGWLDQSEFSEKVIIK